jgi:hypothetical protein
MCGEQVAALQAENAALVAQVARRDRQLDASRHALRQMAEDRNALLAMARHPRTAKAVGATWALAKHLQRHPTVSTRVPMGDIARVSGTSGATMTRLMKDLQETALHVKRVDHPAADGRPKQTEVWARLRDPAADDGGFQLETRPPSTAATVQAILHALPKTARVSEQGNTHGGNRKSWCATCKKDTPHIVERRRIERCAECETVIDDTLTILRVAPDGTSAMTYYGGPHRLTPQAGSGFHSESIPTKEIDGFQDESRPPSTAMLVEEAPPIPTGRVLTPDGAGWVTGFMGGKARVKLDASPDDHWFDYQPWELTPASDIPPEHWSAADD